MHSLALFTWGYGIEGEVRQIDSSVLVRLGEWHEKCSAQYFHAKGLPRCLLFNSRMLLCQKYCIMVDRAESKGWIMSLNLLKRESRSTLVYV